MLQYGQKFTRRESSQHVEWYSSISGRSWQGWLTEADTIMVGIQSQTLDYFQWNVVHIRHVYASTTLLLYTYYTSTSSM